MSTRPIGSPPRDRTPAPFPAQVAAAPNRFNVWTCVSCKRQLVAVDRHVGVTPFMVTCDPERTPGGCGGAMCSAWYRVNAHAGAALATHEWYMPDESERASLARIPGMIEHVMKGGLDIRPIAGAAARRKDG